MRRKRTPAAAELVARLVGARVTDIRGTAIDLEMAGGPGHLDMGETAAAWAVGGVVSDAELAADGTLSVRITNADVISPPSNTYEAWTVRIEPYLAVCAMGGEIVVFRPANWVERLRFEAPGRPADAVDWFGKMRSRVDRAPKALVESLAGASVSSVSRDDGHATGVTFEARRGGVRLVADGAGSGWIPGLVVADAELAEDGTLTVVAGQTAFVSRPHADHEAWLLRFEREGVTLVCGPGGDVQMIQEPVGLLARLRRRFGSRGG